MRRLLWLTFVVLDGVLVLLFCAGFMAAYLHPGRFWWAALAGAGLPYLSLALLLTTPILFLTRRWRMLGVHLVLLGLAIYRFWPLGLTSHTRAPGEDDLVVMSYNVPVRGMSPERLAAATIDVVRRPRPDLLALQEATIWRPAKKEAPRATPHIQAVMDSLGYLGLPPPCDTCMTEQPVVARFALDGQTAHGFDADGRLPTYFTRTQFRWQGREAVIYNLHLRSFDGPKPWQTPGGLLAPWLWAAYLRGFQEVYAIRAREVEHVRRMIEEEVHPVIVAGDLNSTPHNWEYRQLGRGLQDTFKRAGRGWGGTYHTRLPLLRIDHILVSPEWEVVSARASARAGLSDHRPVLARLRWKSQPEQDR